MLRGREAIRKAFEIEQKYEKLEFKRDKVEVSKKGNMAYEIVNQTVSFKYLNLDPQVEINKYIHIWEKQKDGSWKVLIDMNNSRKPSGQ
jgi:ketosteroid isomerase-like protein